MRLGELVDRFGGELRGNGEVQVTGVATLAAATATDLSFLANPRYRSQLASCGAAAVVVSPEAVEDCRVAAIVTPQPYLYFARAAQWLCPESQPAPGIHPTAVVETEVPPSASIGPHAWIGAGSRIGEGAIIGAHCCIGAGCSIGEASRLHPRVAIAHGCRVGARAIIHSGAVIGADGFGFARDAEGNWVKIPQTGRVVIGDDVEIGANTTIDRGALDDTVIGDGVKLDNQIQVAHNVRIGDRTAIAGCVAIAGSTHIGARCTIGGAASIIGHLVLADDVHVSACTLVTKSIPRSGSYTGSVPFLEHGAWQKNFARLRHLEAMADRIRALELRLAELEKST